MDLSTTFIIEEIFKNEDEDQCLQRLEDLLLRIIIECENENEI